MKRTQNIEIAQSLMYFDKSIAMLRCGVSERDFIYLSDLFRNKGWYVYEIEPIKLLERGGDRIASILVICDATAFPFEYSDALERYIKENGRVFVFDGQLFNNKDITQDALVIEGVSPLYKTFREEKCESFETMRQCVSAERLTGTSSYAICPFARPNGEGYNKGRHCRILPIVAVTDSESQETRGSSVAAYFVFSDTIGHMVKTPGTRLGNVSPITQGSEIAVIGMPLSSVLKMKGEALILDMMTALDIGIFFFEAGSEKYVVSPNESISVGAKIISASRDFENVRVRFTLAGVTKEKTVCVAGQNYTNVTEMFDKIPEGEYVLLVELIYNDRVIDMVESTIFVTNGRHSSSKDDFISVENGNFKLHKNNWYMYGINYFPSYHISLEINDYWRGVFEKSVYIPSEVDKDLAYIKKCGMNCVAIRIDCNSFENIIDQLKDFFCRCAKYDLKVMMSFCNITNPLYFNEIAFAEFVKQLDIADDPTLFAHDIFWESGGGFVGVFNSRKFAGEWKDWLVEYFGSIENAEKTFGVPLDRTPAGDVICPFSEHFHKRDMECRVMMTMFTRFCTEMVGRKWNRAIKLMKKYDNNHLYTNRIGHLDDTTPNVFLSAAAKHLDFMCLEAYSITLDDTGFLASVALDRAAHCVSGGKPVTWVEYGISLPGMSGLAVGTKILWDGERNAPVDWRLEEQRSYQEQFNSLFAMCDVKGTMPWFFPGGFRFTEHSDCGYITPNGKNRPAMDEYLKLKDWFIKERVPKKITERVVANPDGEISHWCTFVYGEGVYSKFAFDRARLLDGIPLEDSRVWGVGIKAADRARKEGGCFEFVMAGSENTSQNTPLLLCGDAEYHGYGVLKYLDSEFSYVELCNDDNVFSVENGDEIRVSKGKFKITAGIGNIAASKWICGNDIGCVMLKCNETLMPISKDAEYLDDVTAEWEMEIDRDTELVLRLTAIDRADFGEIYRIKIKTN